MFKASEKIVVIGGSGFIGRNIFNSSVKLGYEAFAIDKSRPRSPNGIKANVFGKLSESVRNSLRQSHIIYSCGLADLESCALDFERAVDLNVDGLRKFLDHLSTLEVKSFTFISSLHVKKSGLDNYSETKLFGEFLVKNVCVTYSIPFKIVRMGSCFGFNPSHGNRIEAVISEIEAGVSVIEMPADVGRRYVYVEEIFSRLKQLWLRSEPIVDLVGDDMVFTTDLVSMVTEILDCECKLRFTDDTGCFDDMTVINRDSNFVSDIEVGEKKTFQTHLGEVISRRRRGN